MKCNKLFFAMIIFFFSATAVAEVSNTLQELEALGKKWKSFNHEQKAFAKGYAFYKEGELAKAKKEFLICDGKYPLLQGYITNFLNKISSGGENFSCLDYTKANEDEIKSIEKSLVKENLDESERGKLTFQLAKAYFRNRQYQESLDFFTESAEYSEFRLSSLEYIATCYARLQNNESAIKFNRQIIEEYPRNKQAVSKALSKIAFLYLDDGDYKEAYKEYAKLRKTYPTFQKDQSEWNLAWSAYKLKKFGEAEKRFASLEKGRGLWKTRAKYWRARMLDEMGKCESAKEIYQELMKKNKYSYYGIISGWKLDVGRTVVDPLDVEEDEDEDDKIDSAEISPDDEAVNAEHLAVARELDFLGANELVAAELENIVTAKENKIDWQEIYKLAKRNDAWHVVNLLAKSGRVKGMNKWEASYPKAYSKIVRDLAGKNKVDPLFVWGVMREESTFKPAVISRSGAIGLLQLMPFTAKRMMADRIFRIEGLFVPYYNITAGTRYLSFLVKRYDNNLFLAAAGYNAGEEAVDRWTEKLDGLTNEEFVEEIPYKETQEYVRKVMRAYWIYQMLYGN